MAWRAQLLTSNTGQRILREDLSDCKEHAEVGQLSVWQQTESTTSAAACVCGVTQASSPRNESALGLSTHGTQRLSNVGKHLLFLSPVDGAPSFKEARAEPYPTTLQ
jgi:hypothetical protein